MKSKTAILLMLLVVLGVLLVAHQAQAERVDPSLVGVVEARERVAYEKGYAEADRHPPVFDPATHTVAVPDAVKRAYRLLWDGEWWRLGLPPASPTGSDT